MPRERVGTQEARVGKITGEFKNRTEWGKLEK